MVGENSKFSQTEFPMTPLLHIEIQPPVPLSVFRVLECRRRTIQRVKISI